MARMPPPKEKEGSGKGKAIIEGRVEKSKGKAAKGKGKTRAASDSESSSGSDDPYDHNDFRPDYNSPLRENDTLSQHSSDDSDISTIPAPQVFALPSQNLYDSDSSNPSSSSEEEEIKEAAEEEQEEEEGRPDIDDDNGTMRIEYPWRISPPALTFGLGIEFVFAARREWYNEFLSTNEEEKQQSGDDDDIASTSSNSQSPGLHDKLLGYVLAFMNRELPSSRPPVSADEDEKVEYPNYIGRVKGELEAHSQGKKSAGSWYLKKDENLKPHRSDLAEFLQTLKMPLEEVKHTWRNGGLELVSPEFSFYDDEEEWQRVISDIHRTLKWGDTDDEKRRDQGSWFIEKAHLHLHFEFEEIDDALLLATAKNLVAIYGLFEHEIERWLPVYKRDDPRIRRLRDGMAVKQIEKTRKEGTWFIKNHGKRYTPAEYCSLIQEQEDLSELKTMVTGMGRDGTWKDKTKRQGNPFRDWSTVNIAQTSANKVSFEFRHHDATMEPERIQWWAQFCGRLLSYAALCAYVDLAIEDDDADGISEPPLKPSESIILSLLMFPPDGQEYFSNQADKEENNFDLLHNMKRDLEKRVIEARKMLVKMGEQTGDEMDNKIMEMKWYQNQLIKLGEATSGWKSRTGKGYLSTQAGKETIPEDDVTMKTDDLEYRVPVSLLANARNETQRKIMRDQILDLQQEFIFVPNGLSFEEIQAIHGLIE